MPLLPRRFERLKTVLNQRMADLTVLLEHVEKPHHLSAILRSCDAVGALEAHAVSLQGRPRTFNSTAQGSQKWVALHDHPDIGTAIRQLKDRGSVCTEPTSGSMPATTATATSPAPPPSCWGLRSGD